MYAIIRTGGKQAKVHEGDVLDVERLRGDDAEVTFTPLLVVDDDGNVISGRDNLDAAKVVAEIVGDSSGPKVDIFKYKNKTGYRRRQGHRQKYTQIRVTKIEVPGSKAPAKKAAAQKSKAENPTEDEASEDVAAAAPEAEESPKAPAKKASAKKTTAKQPPAEQPEGHATEAPADEEA
jgi:large subunit ribosomal protein L21